MTSKIARKYTDETLRVAMLCFTSFGASNHPIPQKVAKAVSIIRDRDPSIEVDGEMQVDVALNPKLRKKEFPFCQLKEDANILIFPDLSSANIGYKLLTNLSKTICTGPILVE